MSPRNFPLAFLCLLLFSSLRMEAQSSCGFDPTPYYEKLSRLTNEYINTATRKDSITVPIEESLAGTTGTSPVEEIWYVPANPGSSTGPLYRHYSSSRRETLDDPSSPFTALPGYSQQRVLGYPYTARVRDGVKPMSRYVNVTTNDYRTWLQSQAPSGFQPNATWWATGATPRLGYERFANKLLYTDVYAAAYDKYGMNNSYLKVDINKIWGNGIGRITHLGTGRQIVIPGIGEMVQTTLRFNPPEGLPAGCIQPNPTQSGGTHCGVNYGETRAWAGSPVVSVVGPSATEPYTLTSVVRPLEFCSSMDFPANWDDTNGRTILAWDGYIERTETLSCRVNGTLQRDVLKSASRLKLVDHSSLTSITTSQTNTHWLDLPSYGDPRTNGIRLAWINLDTGAEEVVNYYNGGVVSWNQTYVKDNVNHRLALRVSSANGAFATGIARLDSATSATDRTEVTLRCTDPGNVPCNPNQTQLIIKVTRRSNSVVKTTYNTPLESYMVVNSQAVTTQRLLDLKVDGGDCLN
ncbi:MAG: hypothetical protein SF066_17565 [Thermoanaerobaculia bacterium]|nr:hypothetical protein [Thermoanaerobaculia bacterium]